MNRWLSSSGSERRDGMHRGTARAGRSTSGVLGRPGVFGKLVLLGVLGAIAVTGAVQAGEPILPQYASDKHEGVSSCDGSTCHGSAGPRNDRSVLQNEFTTWINEDRHHTRAYKVLLEPASIAISRNLGRKAKPHQDDLCLDCHSDNPPAAQRRTENNAFRIDDGVGCEGCHGGAERWLRPHDSGSTHAKNLELGLYPTDDPVARARLCLSCHFGDRKKFVNHRLMGAGHPRQSFELALFSILQPYHWEPDEDYGKRGKQAPNDIKLWAIGQAVAIDEILDAMLDPARNRLGLFPEFVLYDCHACHHDITQQQRWKPRASTGLGPGVARLNDASFLMLMQALELIDPGAAGQLRTDLRALHQAASDGRGDATSIAKEIRGRIAAWLPKLSAWKIDASVLRKLAGRLLAQARAGELADYAASEQAAMAIQTVVYNYLIFGLIDDPTYDALESRELACVLAAVENPDTYLPARAQQCFKQLEAKLAGR